jgi:disulfide bond formation protein DsbB
MPEGEAAGRLARWLALLVPAALLGGAYAGQYLFGLWPCEMCWWQRYPHFAAIPLALAALIRPPGRVLVLLAGLAVLVSGLIGFYHAGVEYGWFPGLTACTSEVALGGDPLEAIMNAPLVRCDQVQWELWGISLAGFNFLISTAAALAIFLLLRRSGRMPS